jgi:hypothetical protein
MPNQPMGEVLDTGLGTAIARLRQLRERMGATLSTRFLSHTNALLFQDPARFIPSDPRDSDPEPVIIWKRYLSFLLEAENMLSTIHSYWYHDSIPKKLISTPFLPIQVGNSLIKLRSLATHIYQDMENITHSDTATFLFKDSLPKITDYIKSALNSNLSDQKDTASLAPLNQAIQKTGQLIETMTGLYFTWNPSAPTPPDPAQLYQPAHAPIQSAHAPSIQEQGEPLGHLLLEPLRTMMHLIPNLNISAAEKKEGYYLNLDKEPDALSKSIKALYNTMLAINKLVAGYSSDDTGQKFKALYAHLNALSSGMKTLKEFWYIEWDKIPAASQQRMQAAIADLIKKFHDYMGTTYTTLANQIHDHEHNMGFRYGTLTAYLSEPFKSIEYFSIAYGVPIHNPFSPSQADYQQARHIHRQTQNKQKNLEQWILDVSALKTILSDHSYQSTVSNPALRQSSLQLINHIEQSPFFHDPSYAPFIDSFRELKNTLAIDKPLSITQIATTTLASFIKSFHPAVIPPITMLNEMEKVAKATQQKQAYVLLDQAGNLQAMKQAHHDFSLSYLNDYGIYGLLRATAAGRDNPDLNLPQKRLLASILASLRRENRADFLHQAHQHAITLLNHTTLLATIKKLARLDPPLARSLALESIIGGFVPSSAWDQWQFVLSPPSNESLSQKTALITNLLNQLEAAHVVAIVEETVSGQPEATQQMQVLQSLLTSVLNTHDAPVNIKKQKDFLLLLGACYRDLQTSDQANSSHAIPALEAIATFLAKLALHNDRIATQVFTTPSLADIVKKECLDRPADADAKAKRALYHEAMVHALTLDTQSTSYPNLLHKNSNTINDLYRVIHPDHPFDDHAMQRFMQQPAQLIALLQTFHDQYLSHHSTAQEKIITFSTAIFLCEENVGLRRQLLQQYGEYHQSVHTPLLNMVSKSKHANLWEKIYSDLRSDFKTEKTAIFKKGKAHKYDLKEIHDLPTKCYTLYAKMYAIPVKIQQLTKLLKKIDPLKPSLKNLSIFSRRKQSQEYKSIYLLLETINETHHLLAEKEKNMISDRLSEYIKILKQEKKEKKDPAASLSRLESELKDITHRYVSINSKNPPHSFPTLS